MSDEPNDDVVSSLGEILLYPTEDGRYRVECRFASDTLWLSQAAMVELYQSSKANVSLHLQNIFEDGELIETAVVKQCLTTAVDGKRYRVNHYHLDAVLAVGYRVRSPRGTQFRRWATARLSEYLVKGFTMDDERLKNPPGLGVRDHFDELLERIRDIRASERRMYLRVRDIFALAADYQPKEADTASFFQIIQNKLHFSATGKTAPELIRERANHTAPNMGLNTWKGSMVLKADVTVAKNYLSKEEIDQLNRVVVMFLDYAEDQAKRRKQVFMHEWQEKLDAFLAFNDRPVLSGAGTRRRKDADNYAEKQYALFEAKRREDVENTAEVDIVKHVEEISRRLPKKK